jgi:hypothetical protein
MVRLIFGFLFTIQALTLKTLQYHKVKKLSHFVYDHLGYDKFPTSNAAISNNVHDILGEYFLRPESLRTMMLQRQVFSSLVFNQKQFNMTY